MNKGKFIFKRSDSEEELNEIYRLRYKVYVEEWGFERSQDHPEGIERDEFDEHAIHFLAKRADQIIGTIRIIRNSEKGFPLEHHCTLNTDLSSFGRNTIGEISRLAVSKDYRRRAEDKYLYGAASVPQEEFSMTALERRSRQEIVLGLYKCMYRESKKIDLTHWCVAMARGLYVLLRRMGIVFTPIGPEINYHGLRTPYLVCIEDLEREISRTKPSLYREFAEELMH
jgi:N-acyl amino acid synthase of PEP-CTERM/exosortase system